MHRIPADSLLPCLPAFLYGLSALAAEFSSGLLTGHWAAWLRHESCSREIVRAIWLKVGYPHHLVNGPLCGLLLLCQGLAAGELTPGLPLADLTSRNPPGEPWSIGEPTDEEQLCLEYINRWRADPAAAASQFATITDPDVRWALTCLGVDLGLLRQQVATNPPAPPLAMNAKLLQAARRHSRYMLRNACQGHFETTDQAMIAPPDRFRSVGYEFVDCGENVFAYARSVFHCQAAFLVDWDNSNGSVGGMQNPPQHRDHLFQAGFREVGIAVVAGSNGATGPYVVTQDFGTRPDSRPIITGVVFLDLNHNGRFDSGEGLGGVQIVVPGNPFYAVSAPSGGYAIPVPKEGCYRVEFSAPHLSASRNINVSAGKNCKLDLVVGYVQPEISKSEDPKSAQNQQFIVPIVHGAVGYQWECGELRPCECLMRVQDRYDQVAITSSPGYEVFQQETNNSAATVFRLAHVPDPINPTDQVLELKSRFLVGTNSQLCFCKRLGYAFSNEVARVQVSTDAGDSWLEVWQERGNGGQAINDQDFVFVTNSLAAFAGRIVQVRFLYSHQGGHYFLPARYGGLFLSRIWLTGTEEVLNAIAGDAAPGLSSFSPATGVHCVYIRVRARLPERWLPWGPAYRQPAAQHEPAHLFTSN